MTASKLAEKDWPNPFCVRSPARNRLQAVALGFLLSVGGAIHSTDLLAGPIDAAKSSLSATFKQFNVPVTGDFKQFAGDVVFDPAKPAQTQATLTVKTASYDLGDPEYNAEVAGKDWFASDKHPDGVFKLKSIKPLGAGYEATGELTLRGVAKPVVFPASFEAKNGGTEFKGEAVIKRLDYGIGQGSWSETDLVADEVVIKFKIFLPKGSQ